MCHSPRTLGIPPSSRQISSETLNPVRVGFPSVDYNTQIPTFYCTGYLAAIWFWMNFSSPLPENMFPYWSKLKPICFNILWSTSKHALNQAGTPWSSDTASKAVFPSSPCLQPTPCFSVSSVRLCLLCPWFPPPRKVYPTDFKYLWLRGTTLWNLCFYFPFYTLHPKKIQAFYSFFRKIREVTAQVVTRRKRQGQQQ